MTHTMIVPFEDVRLVMPLVTAGGAGVLPRNIQVHVRGQRLPRIQSVDLHIDVDSGPAVYRIVQSLPDHAPAWRTEGRCVV